MKCRCREQDVQQVNSRYSYLMIANVAEEVGILGGRCGVYVVLVFYCQDIMAVVKAYPL